MRLSPPNSSVILLDFLKFDRSETKAGMAFALIDRIVEYVPREYLVATKCVTLGEEYLRDHFPKFPVLPGVLMLETLYQASSWLARVSDDFRHSLVLLQEARNVRYSGLVTPGSILTARVEWEGEQGLEGKFRGRGAVDGTVVVTAGLTLVKQDLATENPGWTALDHDIRISVREEFDRLVGRSKSGL